MSLTNPNTPVSQQDLQDFYHKILPYIGGSDGASTMSELSDTTINDLQDGQILKWDNTNTKWVNSDESGSGHTIEDSQGSELEQRDTLQFGEGFLTEDDDTNEKTVISPNVMQSGDINDVLSQLPTLHAGREVFISGILTAGNTEITLTSDYITTSSIIDPYTDTFGVNPTNVVVTAGQVVLTFKEQENDLGVGISIK